MENKTYEIYHYKYSEDSHHRKEVKCETVGYVVDTEENVRTLVEKLNIKNNSQYSTSYSDYYAFIELEISSIEELEMKIKFKLN